MISESQTKLLPSDEFKQELAAIIKARPELQGLTRRQPEDPEPGRQITQFAFVDGENKVYPLIEIPGPWKGKAYVGRVPGSVKGSPVDFELNAIKDFGISHIVCLVPEEDLSDGYRVPKYAPAAREQLGDAFTVVEVLDYEPAVDDEAFENALDKAYAALEKGETILAHCGAACGRTGMFLSCLMVKYGMDTADAIKQYRKARGCGPETEDQVAYVARYQDRLKSLK